MKQIIALCLLTLSVSAQNRMLVRFYPHNQPFAGLTNYPAATVPVSFSTNAPGWNTNMAVADYNAHVLSLMPSYNAASSNAQSQVDQTLKNNIALVIVAYSNLQWVANNWDSVTNLANLKIAVKAEGDLLLKLKPVLIQMYKGE